MKILNIKRLLSVAMMMNITSQTFALPTGFVYLNDIDSSIIQEMRYYTTNNFTGERIPGYEAPSCILTYQAAMALHGVQQRLKKLSLSLKVYDCYRPQQAVDYFVRWSRNADQKMKPAYYPHVNKIDLFKLDYISEHSGHTRGSTIDLSLVKVDGKSHIDLPMGTHFDYLDPASHPFALTISQTAKKNRMLLRSMMLNASFKPIATEWWHFTLSNEPFINQYFNFPVR